MARDFPGDTADVDAEILAGFVEAVHAVAPCGPRLAARLLAVPWNRAKVARRAERACAGRKVGTRASVAPARPWGHPDLVLARAVAEDAITDTEAELIGTTRLGGTDLHTVAEEWGVAYEALRRRRYRAECRLVRWLSNGSSVVPNGLREAFVGAGRPRGDVPGSRTLRPGRADRGGEHPTAGPSPEAPTPGRGSPGGRRSRAPRVHDPNRPARDRWKDTGRRDQGRVRLSLRADGDPALRRNAG